jgi:very-short-patch-repair endonuclease
MSNQHDSLHRNPPRLTTFARDMRQDPSKAENVLWQILRNRQINGYKFRRQQVMGNYIADFLCHDCHLVVELDGDSHDGREAYDLERTRWFESQGFKVIRFSNFDVLENVESVIEEIRRAGGSSA